MNTNTNTPAHTSYRTQETWAQRQEWEQAQEDEITERWLNGDPEDYSLTEVELALLEDDLFTTNTSYRTQDTHNNLATLADYEEMEQALEDEDEFTDEEIEGMQDDLFVPQDQRHLDRLSYLSINELMKLPQTSWDVQLDPELYDVIHSTLRMENALDLIDIWD